MTSIFNDDFFFFPHAIFNTNNKPTFPVKDIFHEEDEVVVEYALAGYSKDKIEIWSEGTNLCISVGKRKAKRPYLDYAGYKIASRGFSEKFETKGLDLDRIKISFIDGILRIEIPRVKPAAPEKKVFEIT